MGDFLPDLLIHISYLSLGYSTFKELKSATDKNAEVLVGWAACTALFTIRNWADPFLSWLPWYFTIKTMILCILLIEKNICKGFFKSFLINRVKDVEKLGLEIYYLWAKCASWIMRPVMPIILKQYLISGSNPSQLSKLKLEVDNFLTDIRKRKLDFSNSEFDVKLEIREDTFFPHKMWYVNLTNELHWKAQGDNLEYSDNVLSVEIVNKRALLAKVVMQRSNKRMKFNREPELTQWYEHVKNAIKKHNS